MTIKQCKKCGQPKPIEHFCRYPRSTDGLYYYCRECKRNELADWRQSHRENVRAYHRAYYATPTGKATHRAAALNWRRKHGYMKRKWRSSPAYRAWCNLPQNRLAHALRCRIRRVLRKTPKSNHTEVLLGCSFEEAKVYIESMFQPGMSWDNYGQWHVDHIIPYAYFDLTKTGHQRMCFNYRNLQPLWAIDNGQKHSRITIDNLQEHLAALTAAIQ